MQPVRLSFVFYDIRPQFESVHHQNRRLSSHSYSHESVIFSKPILLSILLIIIITNNSANSYI